MAAAPPLRSLGAIVIFALIISLVVLTANGDGEIDDVVAKNKSSLGVTYDGRSLIIHGKRELIFSGSIHYPRVQEDMWDDVLEKAKQGGINCIQTYVFWNVHEPRKGEFNFSGNYNLVKFIKKIDEHGMYATLRVGPFIQGEWNHGGLPFWLRDIPHIIFRSNNPDYKREMEAWVSRVVNMMKENKLYASQGGPIILSQIENEYDHIKASYKANGNGEKYIKWAAEMAVAQNTGVPWLMCKQTNAPGEVINACNGRHCGETFVGRQLVDPSKPKIWTENWVAQFRVFGDPPSQRSAEDIAHSVSRWFAANGSHVNYYMYYGGTNYGRTAGTFATTAYYDEAPLDEFGFLREPKYGHLRDLHYALALSKAALLWGRYSVERPCPNSEITVFESPEKNLCAAFIRNANTREPQTFKFRGSDYKLPQKSVTILPDCKTEVFNTKKVVSQHNARSFTKSETVHKTLKEWEMFSEIVQTIGDHYTMQPLEQYFLARDTTDYVWYSTSIDLDISDLPMRKSIRPVLQIRSIGHGVLAFVNGQFVGTSHGIKRKTDFYYDVPVTLKDGMNHLSFLSYTVGMPDSGSYMEHRFTGVRTLVVQGLTTGTLDLTSNGWHHRVGLKGENLEIFTEEGSKKVQWVPASKGPVPPITWYKSYFDAPEGNGPLSIKMDNMTKGMVWINGNSIGRYWNFYTPLNEVSQKEYHIPRSFLKPKDNLIVIFEEGRGLINTAEIMEVSRDQICSFIKESYPPHVRSWKRTDKKILEAKEDQPKTKATLRCTDNKVIKGVEFASFGNPWGICGMYLMNECHSPLSQKVVEHHCLGKNECSVPIDRNLFNVESVAGCHNVTDMTLAVQVICGFNN